MSAPPPGTDGSAAPDSPAAPERSAAPDGSAASDRSAAPDAPMILDLFVYLCVKDADAAIIFYTEVFGARETLRLADPAGRVGHAELRFGPATVMVCDEHPEHGILGPLPTGARGARVHLHVDDVDRLAERAAAEGAVILMEPTDQGHGERQCRLRDPFGQEWLLGHQLEALSDDEIKRRYDAEVRDPP
jgi:PhnB protein